MRIVRGAWLRAACLAATLMMSGAPVSAQQDIDPAVEARARQIQDRAFAAFARKDFSAAERLLRQQLELEPSNFVVYYNLACARALQGDGAGAGEFLKQAVEKGFTDITMLRTDPDLANARNDENYLKIVNNWGTLQTLHRDSNLEHARKMFSGREYQVFVDDGLRLAYLSAADPKSFEQARADITKLAAWGVANVLTDLAGGEGEPRDAWVVVVLPTPADFNKWSRAMFGAQGAAGFSTIGGLYSHDSKRLVAMDLGATLRHEFFHVLHWRSVSRLRQDHPPWIQEGLCSLVEDYELRADGNLEPVASWRTNIARRLARTGLLMPIRQLATMSRDKFISTRPLATYGQARAVFLFLWQTGKLKDWYTAYTEEHAADPSGVAALERVYGKPIDEIDKDYRKWARELPEVAEQSRPGSVGLGVDVEAGAGDGPVIVSVGRRSAARAAGLRVNDVITAIDGKPTRDMNELVRILGEHEAGDEVEVSYRRGREHGAVMVKLSYN